MFIKRLDQPRINSSSLQLVSSSTDLIKSDLQARNGLAQDIFACKAAMSAHPRRSMSPPDGFLGSLSRFWAVRHTDAELETSV